MFELRMKITQKLCFANARHCDVFLLRCDYIIYLFDVVTFVCNQKMTKNYVIIRNLLAG